MEVVKGKRKNGMRGISVFENGCHIFPLNFHAIGKAELSSNKIVIL